jgi:hypothetical protein
MSTHLRLPRITLLAALACVVLVALATADSGAASTPVERSARTCKTPAYYYVGASEGYFRRLQVTNVSCTFGIKLFKAYQRCRNPTGGRPRGTCRKPVLEFRCTEGARTFSDDGAGGYSDFSARVTCRRGIQRVIFSYTQNL